ncbi:hypothetical protein HK19_15450 [Acetobacter persici]|uniref:hypothetical protein n=1 Tax=Acetobacter persici TaxID=1076596 RepID=UPI000A3D046E|nr:hypothetical protein [Acetobacter persici]OUI89041.1 hypothetical protein HK19_15450 [Acetobacter persici]
MGRIIFFGMLVAVGAGLGISFLRSLVPPGASPLVSEFLYYAAPAVTILGLAMVSLMALNFKSKN